MSPERADGFTLLEVLVALAIAGLALVLMFQAGGGGLFAVDTAARVEEAVARAQSHLAAVGNRSNLAPGVSEGDDGGGYHWQLRITPLVSRQVPVVNSVMPAETTLFNVEVAVSWHGDGHDRSVVLQTRRLGLSTGTR